MYMPHEAPFRRWVRVLPIGLSLGLHADAQAPQGQPSAFQR